MRSFICAVCAFVALAFPTALAQSMISSSQMVSNGQRTVIYTINIAQLTLGFLQGHPYSADEITQQTNTLADSTRMVRTSQPNFLCRDFVGRTRTEKRPPAIPKGNQIEIPALVEILDPVLGLGYYLDTVNRVAHRLVLRQPIRFAPAPQARYPNPLPPIVSTPSTPDDPITSSERLGTKTLEGIRVEGQRITMTYPIGSVGNDRPIVTTKEIWQSRELNTTILSTSYDPRSGESIHALINISLAEPDPSLFQIPPGYKVVDETGSFTITITSASPKSPVK